MKTDLVADAKAAVGNLKEAGNLKVKALKDGVKAIGTAKLGVVKGIKAAKVAKVKSIADAKLAKVEAVKASKLALAQKLLSAKLGKFAAIGAHFGFSKGTSGSSASSSSSASASASTTSGAPVSNFGTILQFGGDDKVTLYPPINAAPTHINIVTYRNDASNGRPSAATGNANGHAPVVVPAPFTSYGTPLAQGQTKVVSRPLTSYTAPIRAIPPSTSYGVPILR